MAGRLWVCIALVVTGIWGGRVEGQGGQGNAPADFLAARAAFNDAGARGDKAAYARYLAPDVTWIDVSGRLRDRAGLIADVTPGPPATLTAIDAFAYPGGLVLTGHRVQNNSRFLQLWVKDGQDWLLVAHQGAPMGSAQPSPGAPSKTPEPVGTKAERDAVWRNVDALAVAGQKGDADAVGRLVTDRFITISNTGILRDRKARLEQLRQSGPGGSPVVPVDISTRIHGQIAVTVDRSGNRADGSSYPPSRRTVIHVRQGDAWLEAASIITLIVPGKR